MKVVQIRGKRTRQQRLSRETSCPTVTAVGRKSVVDSRDSFAVIGPRDGHRLSEDAGRWQSEYAEGPSGESWPTMGFPGRQRCLERRDARGRRRDQMEAITAVGGDNHLYLLSGVHASNNVYIAVDSDIDFGREGVGGQDTAYRIGSSADPGDAVVQGTREAQVRSVVPNNVDAAVKRGTAAIARGPSLFVLGAGVYEVWRAPGFSAVGRLVSDDPYIVDLRRVLYGSAHQEDVSAIVPREGWVRNASPAGSYQRRRIVPGNSPVCGVDGGYRKVICADVFAFPRRRNNLVEIVRVDEDDAFAPRIVQARAVRNLDVRQGGSPFFREQGPIPFVMQNGRTPRLANYD